MSVSELELKEIAEGLLSGESILSSNVDVIKDLKVKMNVVLGSSSINVEELMSLKEGSVVKVDRKVNTALDIYIKDKLVAKGIMVVVDDQFGIKITELGS